MKVPPRLKVCCIASVEEARAAIAHGASALGLVSAMPSGPGVIGEEAIAEIARQVPPPIGTFLLTSATTSDAIVAQQRRCGTNTLQICDYVDTSVYRDLRRELSRPVQRRANRRSARSGQAGRLRHRNAEGPAGLTSDGRGSRWACAVAHAGRVTSAPMSRNVEIKARVADLAAVEHRAASFATGPTLIHQDDTFFAGSRGRLKLRELADGSGQLIHYERPDAMGPKVSDYVLSTTLEPATLREALTRAYGVLGRVKKVRRLYMSGRTRIHLDQVERLGSFVELEVVLDDGENPEDGQREARDVMAALGITEASLVPGAYLDLLGRDNAAEATR